MLSTLVVTWPILWEGLKKIVSFDCFSFYSVSTADYVVMRNTS